MNLAEYRQQVEAIQYGKRSPRHSPSFATMAHPWVKGSMPY
jgi:hypothetical protein